MSQHSRGRGAGNSISRTAPNSVIIALLATIALVMVGLGSPAAVGMESSSIILDDPVESIDPEAHVPGATYMSEKTDTDEATLDDLLTSLNDLNSVVDQPEGEDFPAAEPPVVEEQPAVEVPVEGESGDMLEPLPDLMEPGLPLPINRENLLPLQVDGPNPPMEVPEQMMDNRVMPLAEANLPATSLNPPLPQRCGVNVAVVLDLSNSVKTANGVQPTKNATNAIIDAVGGSGGAVGIFTFSTRAPSTGTVNRPWMELTTPQQVQAAKNHVNGLNTPSNTNLGGTNWEGALKRVDEANRPYDIVYFITDGVPTANESYNGNVNDNNYSHHSWDPGVYTHFSDLSRAINASNALKAEGMYVAPVAVGLQTTDQTVYRDTGGVIDHHQTGQEMLQQIDPNYLLVDNYLELETLINSILVSCESRVVVEKQIVDSSGKVISNGAPDYLAGGWEFTMSGLSSGFEFSDGNSTTRVVTTADVNGRTPVVELETDSPTTTGDIRIAETVEEGFQLFQQGGMNATCRIGSGLNPDTATGWQGIPITNSGDTGFTAEVEAGHTTYCVVQNRELETSAALEKSPRPGAAVYANPEGEAELVYTVKVGNAAGGTTGSATAETGTIWESVLLPAYVTARDDITIEFTADTGVVADGVAGTIPSGQFVTGAQIPIANNLTLPAGTQANFTIKIPVLVEAGEQEWQQLGSCKAVDGTYSGGVANEVIMELEDYDGLENNIACIPIIQQQVSIEKSPRPGEAVEVALDGSADLVYTVTVTNKGGSTGQIAADSGPIFDSVQIPETVVPRSNIQVSFIGTNGATVTGLATSIPAGNFTAGASIKIADNVTLPSNSTGVFTITIRARVNASTQDEWASLGQCGNFDNGAYRGGVPNQVTMDNDFDGPENNTACIPLMQRKVAVEKGPRPGEAVQTDANGEAELVYTITVSNDGGSNGALDITSAEIVEKVKLTDKVIANGDITVIFSSDNNALASGVVNLIPQAEFIPEAEITIADSVYLPAGSTGVFTLTVPVKVEADTVEEWNELGVCRPGIDGGFSGGVHNQVIMARDADGNGNNIACIPIIEPPTALVTIVKEDHNAVELPGAKFALYAAELDGSEEPTGLGDVLIAELDYADGSDTRFSAEELNSGFYYLVEVQSPAGYSLLPAPIGFELLLLNGEFSLSLLDPESQSHVVQIDDGLIIRVADTTSGALPKSGSYGAVPIVLLAGLILAVGFLSTRKLVVR